MKTPYDVLGIPPDADAAAIRAAFRNAAKTHHPDRNAGDRAAEQRFHQIVVAHNALKGPEWRAFYRYEQLRSRHERRHWAVMLACCAVSALVSGGLVSAVQKDSSPEASYSSALSPASAGSGFASDDVDDAGRGPARTSSKASALASWERDPTSPRRETVMLADAAPDQDRSEAAIPVIAATAGAAMNLDASRYFSTAAGGHATVSASWPLDLGAKNGFPRALNKAAEATHGTSERVTAKQVPAVRADRSIGRALSSILRGTLGSARAAHPHRPPRSVEARAKTPIGRPDRAPRSECWSEVESFRVAVCGAAPGAGS
jgi:curved DNA-binding protein CbpA